MITINVIVILCLEGIEMNHLTEKLIKHNIRPSYIRIEILQYLLDYESHPTVDEIYTVLKKSIPSLSKTTVYNVIDLFVSSNLVRPVAIEENETRYDAEIRDHGHFKCTECGKIYDFEVDMNHLIPEEFVQFKVKQRDVFLNGICEKCL